MPHFVMDCSQSVLTSHKESFIIEQVHFVAYATGLFEEGDIKVRMNPFKNFIVGNKSDDFIHVFAHIMQGRTTEQKAFLSKEIVTKLATMFPDIKNIAMNISDFEKATYCNKAML
ncbi:5-carboxymethyl-2-hydroxymuconate Delta-isomerase [Colwellia sp. 12G3]|uniref:5-carboxymethyl-2-hydroxymuconate Delta-isomerase n=1 Tax=Colwellia sp. 12G3 TaxID=2058299 RepID=UPI000C326D0E|nr:5-carboxymethyl-2-hydroxymuconate Delta-isomerase [Colwellia sp. 12G3]PKI12599.1 5-carboxymethyl-2-hydroxymuconate isomerase [Colwellia sp. 12G3]